ncbi:hypothetical protein FISHEDRAFT_53046, partial [Fistulina hepatica ATCC 64428]
TSTMSESHVVLHVWPAQWSLPSTDPSCLSAIMLMNVAAPKQLRISEGLFPSVSPSGQLPALQNGAEIVSTLPTIIEYACEHWPEPLKTNLSVLEKSQHTAWLAHVQLNLGDLVSYALYGIQENWEQMHAAFAELLAVPFRYYIPGRIRDLHRPRLEAMGLWVFPRDLEKPPKSAFENKTARETTKEEGETNKATFGRAFHHKATTTLDLYSHLLADRPWFFGDKITPLDMVVAAHIHILANNTLPDSVLKTLLTDRYPTLIAHAHSVVSQTLSP